ncbi:predicted protein [Naegleria gruberi]|uniref:Predicted protein n=1 Tax=Naegleria gruberi TaxID=5762 RepID=D2VKS2_NAEGR|nr:uncharacterized protein NAEGRDRAFT_69493 [Naegleria gruberi]EFC42642.1 predicted protein [Naegleria gruberi]|eukprot:XP_002675386.1 predicted protein [Naegleria gruberi strain NEG-M]
MKRSLATTHSSESNNGESCDAANDENKLKKAKMMMATDAMLNCPVEVFVAPNDEIYIADRDNHRVRKILKDGTMVTIAGWSFGGFGGDGGPATSAMLDFPTSIAVSSDNEVYIADLGIYRIRKILRNGNIVTIAGTGEEGFSGDGGPAINAQISAVWNIALSQNNELYFVDYSNCRIRKILRNGTIVTIAGTGEDGFSGDGGLAINAKLGYPCSVFVSKDDEVYIADSQNNRVRKILRNGIINTIAGTGEEGFSGDGGPATNAQLNVPCGVFVSATNEVYIVDSGNCRIRKILRNGIINTIAGTGEEGYSGDGGPAINAQISNVYNIFVSQNDEVYIADTNNHRIRKILKDGTIETIAGNGEKGFSGDSPFDFSSHPHIGNDYTIIPKIQLKKHSRDELFGLELIGFIPLIEKLSPQFCKIILKNEKLLKSMNSQQIEIIQKLIDSLIYENVYHFTEIERLNSFKEYDILNVLFILGMFKNCEFIDFKRVFVNAFINSITLETLPSKWEQSENLLKFCQEIEVENYILEYLNNYCLEYSAIQLRNPQSAKHLKTAPIIMRNSLNIVLMLEVTTTSPMQIEDTEIKLQGMESLFNDEKSSDVKIKISKDQYLYCHKSILSSSCIFFNALFESGSSFSDLSDDVFTPDESEDLELLEISIKSCYGIPIHNSFSFIRLIDIALKHENQCLIYHCKKNFSLTIDNYFEKALECGKYFHLDCFSSFFDTFLSFGTRNCEKLFTDCAKVGQLPEQLRNALIIDFTLVLSFSSRPALTWRYPNVYYDDPEFGVRF